MNYNMSQQGSCLKHNLEKLFLLQLFILMISTKGTAFTWALQNLTLNLLNYYNIFRLIKKFLFH